MLAIVQTHVMILGLPCVVTGVQDLLQEGDLGGRRRENQVGHGVETVKFGDDLESVPLSLDQPKGMKEGNSDGPDR